MRIPRIYLDTSVVGGCFDPEFAATSRGLLEMARAGEAVLLVSDLLLAELTDAPQDVMELLASLPPAAVERSETTPEAVRLMQRYLEDGVVGPASESDALHVAIATVARADVIVSWNFRHIVHFRKIRGFNSVNLREGYAVMAIHNPMEVV